MKTGGSNGRAKTFKVEQVPGIYEWVSVCCSEQYSTYITAYKHDVEGEPL